MFRYKIVYKPFAHAFLDEIITEANDMLEAQANILKIFPYAKIIHSVMLEDNRPLAEVIHYDFRAKKRLA